MAAPMLPNVDSTNGQQTVQNLYDLTDLKDVHKNDFAKVFMANRDKIYQYNAQDVQDILSARDMESLGSLHKISCRTGSTDAPAS